MANIKNLVVIIDYGLLYFAAKAKKKSSSESSTISSHDMKRIVDNLLARQHRDSTAKNYLAIWRQFNKFVISLDSKPKLWGRQGYFVYGLFN